MKSFGMDSDAVRGTASKIDTLNSELDSMVEKLTSLMATIEEKCKGQLGIEFKDFYDKNILTKLKDEIESFRRVVQTTKFAANSTDDTNERVSSSIKSGF